jgi:hypothetical protein
VAVGSGTLSPESAKEVREAWMRDANIRTGRSLVSLATADDMAALGMKLIVKG